MSKQAKTNPTQSTPLLVGGINRASYLVLFVAGLHSPQDENDPLFDARAVNLPINQPLVDKLVKTKSTEGVFPPLETVRKEDGTLWVLDGRERWRAVEAASKVLGFPLDVDYVEYSGDVSPETLFLKSRERNGGRQDDSPYVVAQNADRAKRLYGTTLARFAASSGMSLQDLKMKMRLLKLVPALVEKLFSGELPPTVGFQLAMLPEAEQVQGYNKLVDSNQLTVVGARRLKQDQSQESHAEPGESQESHAEPGESQESHAEPGESETGGEKSPPAENNTNQNSPKSWTGLTLAEVRKIWATVHAETCPLTDETIAVLETILGERPLAEAPKDLQSAVEMLRAGTLPKKKEEPKPPKEPKAKEPKPQTKKPKAQKIPTTPTTTE